MGEKLVQFTNHSPLFKGPALIALGLLALAFAVWVKRKWKDENEFGYWVFVVLSAFLVLFGLYITVFRPLWWKLPY